MFQINDNLDIGIAFTVSAIATIATGGLALPVLGGVGSVVGVAGTVWNVVGSQKKERMEKKILQQIKDIVEKDHALQEEVRHQIAMFEILDDSERDAAGAEIMAIMRGWGGMALTFGPDAAMKVLAACLPPISMFFKGN